MSEPTADREIAALSARHLRFGWALVFAYVLLGLALEAMHAFKLGVYLDVSNETRRLMWTLAHTHGTLIGVLNLAFSLTVARLVLSASELGWCSRLLRWAGLLMPLGFLLGGVVVYGGDPGPGVVLAPIGGLCLVAGVGLAALGGWRAGRES